MTPAVLPETIRDYLRNHPEVERAMALFGIGMEQYSRAFRQPKITTTNTTNYQDASED